ncbi:PREDICTED: deleted in lung and esophageal cancer protein 1-like [Amphimedon queenslandica]|uniref:MSP domain-containing protein n=1 Tax=Amphimedon queenslandica TaxID=400682 RepID=A0A1X7U8G0_AMPQE|nr:PREDICTED: deleted in lung and esophageal cancer protein 1-like [Amphimedon queenslandica]|eukprot:XP_019855733.1 PREDICTED: deleted in lung and esophageal cancer protein 1-like [Amphimedon queenslandica]
MSRVREYRSGEPIKPSPSFLLAPLDCLTPHSVSELIKSYFDEFTMEEPAQRLQIEKQAEFIKEAATEEGDEKTKEENEVAKEKDEEVLITEEDNEEVAVVDSSKDPQPKSSLAPPPTILVPPPVVPAAAVPEDLSTALMELGDDKRKEYVEAYQKRNSTYVQMEQNIHYAISRQLSDQEAQLKSARNTYPNFNSLFLLQQPCPISKYLNEKLLKEGGLLVPGDYQPVTTNAPSHQPPPKEWPVFMQSTVSSNKRAKVDSLAFKKLPRKLPPIWKDSMSSLEREEAKKSLKELYRKRDFIRSPRHLPEEYHTNTASFGSLRKRQAGEKGKPVKSSKVKRLFQAEPTEVIFTDYVPGKTYECVLHLKNISDSCRHVSITAPSTPYFRASLIQFPNAEGIIAPGMSCSYSISFTPDSLADFSDKIKVLSHVGVVLNVPLVGYRSPPNLSLSSEWQCGHCLVGGHSSLTLHCTNSGGEGSFRLTLPEDTTNNDNDKDDLRVGPFTVNPSHFFLSRNESINIEVTFDPQEAITYSHQLILVCSNGQTKTITILGIGEMVKIDCTSIMSSREDTLIRGDTDTDTDTDIVSIDDPVLLFNDTNNGVEVHGTVVVKNFNNVPLSFEWIFYHSRTELTHHDGSTEITPPLSLDPQSIPFTIDAPKGSLSPNETKPFTFCFTPKEEGSFQCMSYLELTGLARDCLNHEDEGVTWLNMNKDNDNDTVRAALLCINVQGNTEPYALEFSPPFFYFVEDLPACAETRQSFVIRNHSLSKVKFSWSSLKTEAAYISIEPNSSHIMPGGSCSCDLIINTGTRKGSFDVKLQCHVEHSNTHFMLPVRGNVKVPLVTVNVPSLDFGLIELGESASLSLKISNYSNALLHYKLNQIVVLSEDNKDGALLPFVDYECLSMSPSEGQMPSCSCVSISVECSPKVQCGRLRTTLECLIEGDRMNVLEVTAEIQCPMLILSESFLHIENCYRNVPVTHTLTLINTSQLHTQFEWINEERDHVDLVFSPDHGPIGPHESINIELKSTWKTKGYIAGMIAVCCARGMKYPVVLSLSAHISGLTVEYSLLANENNNNTLSLPLKMDFGSSNCVREPQSLQLIVTNTSGISSQLAVSVRHFPAPLINGGVNKRKHKSMLLKATPNIANPSSKTEKQAKEELITQLLSDGRGACLTIEPSKCPLLAFESRKINITAYSDMWGEYTDQLICKVDGIDAHVIPVSYGVTSSPIYFQPTATYDNTLIRLGCHQVDSEVVRRNIVFSNVCSSAVRIDWRSFIFNPQDDKIIDLVTYVGHPFPLQDSKDDKHKQEEEEEEEDPCTSTSPLVRAHIFPHEGSPTSDIHLIPNQLIVEPHSKASVTLSFDPKASVYSTVGEQINGYVLGYMTLSDKPAPFANRAHGYNIQPVRINVSASLTQPKLTLRTHTDDNDLSFQHFASDFIFNGEVSKKMVHSHSFSLTNLTLSNLTFRVLSLSEPLMVLMNNEEVYSTLKPRETIEGSLHICLTHEAFMALVKDESAPEDLVTLNDSLVVEYSNSIKQEFPISVRVSLPSLSVYPSHINYNTCLIGHSSLSSFQLRNTSHSSLKWNITLPEKLSRVIQLEPNSNVLDTGSETVRVTFTPRAEIKYSIELLITEEITGKSFTVTVTGRGSSNERYKRHRRK